MNISTIFISLVFVGIVTIRFAFTELPQKRHYIHEWAIEIKGGEKRAREIADEYGFIYVDKIMENHYLFRHNKVAKRSIFPSRYFHSKIAQDKRVLWLEQQVSKRRVKRYVEFNDPEWPKMWYLSRGDGLDMNVQKAWAMGYTGKGVAVTILDDGIEHKHPDLARNYDAKSSYDVNSHDSDPSPRYTYTNDNRHGTRCAGQVAAQANNSDCIVGVAYDAKIGGLRMLDGDVTDSVEAQSLSLNPQHIDIYSASWGPDDDGRTVDGPATLARKAFYDGITRGRGGLGSIFIWASGNGGRHDDCNCDGYTSTIHTLTISSVTESGQVPLYSETCSSTFATAYSSGSTSEKSIVTTDIGQSCTESHKGTSASASIAAGLVALTLQANRWLNWRDLQHIVVLTAKPKNLLDPTWTTNGVGRLVSHSFGYGLMDAAAMVQLARNWTTVPKQHICQQDSFGQTREIPINGKMSLPIYSTGCEGTNNYVKYLEHVQARITLKASRRGDIRIVLTSPMGTNSTLLEKRSQDSSQYGFKDWAFMTTHNWGELSSGRWVLTIENTGLSDESGPASLTGWMFTLFGTDRHPQPSTTTATSSTTPTTTETKMKQRNDPRNRDELEWMLYVTNLRPQQQLNTSTTSSTTPIPATETKIKQRNDPRNRGSIKSCIFESLSSKRGERPKKHRRPKTPRGPKKPRPNKNKPKHLKKRIRPKNRRRPKRRRGTKKRRPNKKRRNPLRKKNNPKNQRMPKTPRMPKKPNKNTPKHGKKRIMQNSRNSKQNKN